MSAKQNDRRTIHPGNLKSKFIDGTVKLGDRITEDDLFRCVESTDPFPPERKTEDN